MIKDYKLDKNGLYIIGKADIEAEIEHIIGEYNPDLLIEPQPIDLEDFTENYLKLNLEYQRLSTDNKFYGLFAFTDGSVDVYDENDVQRSILVKEKTIILDPTITNVGEEVFRFTLGHEDGHYIWQYGIIKNNCYEKYDKHEYAVISHRTPISRKRELITKDDWAEWQANYTSACLLANRTAALKIVSTVLGYDVKYNSGFISRMSGYERLLTKHLFMDRFQMSDRAASIRLLELSDSQ